MDELTLHQLIRWHAAQAHAALDIGRAVDTRQVRGAYMRLAEFHGDAAQLLERIVTQAPPAPITSVTKPGDMHGTSTNRGKRDVER